MSERSLYIWEKEEKLTFKAQELALWYDRDERDSDWNEILSSTKTSLFSVIAVHYVSLPITVRVT